MSEKGLHYIRFFIRGFGKRPLSDLCNNSILSQSVEEYLQKFVQAFGVYLLYTFIQMMRINRFDWLTKEVKNEFRLSFFENGIAVTKMFDLFSKTLTKTDIEELRTALKNQYNGSDERQIWMYSEDLVTCRQHKTIFRFRKSKSSKKEYTP